MRKISRAGAVVAAAVAATSVAVIPAHGAAAAPIAPMSKKKEKAEAPKTPPPPKGVIVICNHSGYMFDVFADGPSIREDDLAGSFDECTDWARVLTGNYQIGFGLRTASGQSKVIIGARFKRDGHVYYKTFNGEGLITGFVNKDETMRVDLFIPQG